LNNLEFCEFAGVFDPTQGVKPSQTEPGFGQDNRMNWISTGSSGRESGFYPAHPVNPVQTLFAPPLTTLNNLEFCKFAGVFDPTSGVKPTPTVPTEF
jgi:hypothetical protein